MRRHTKGAIAVGCPYFFFKKQVELLLCIKNPPSKMV